MEITNEMLSEWLVRVAHGETKYLDDIHLAIGKLLFAVAISILGRKTEAEDVVQDAYLELTRKARKYRVRKNPKAWLCVIVRNMAIDRVRRRQRENAVALTETAAVSDATPNHLILLIFSRLTPKEAELVRMYFWYGYSLSELAAKLHVSKSTVAYRLNAVEDKIRRIYNVDFQEIKEKLKNN